MPSFRELIHASLPLLQQAQQLTCLINRNASGYAEDNAGFLRLT